MPKPAVIFEESECQRRAKGISIQIVFFKTLLNQTHLRDEVNQETASQPLQLSQAASGVAQGGKLTGISSEEAADWIPSKQAGSFYGEINANEGHCPRLQRMEFKPSPCGFMNKLAFLSLFVLRKEKKQTNRFLQGETLPKYLTSFHLSHPESLL